MPKHPLDTLSESTPEIEIPIVVLTQGARPQKRPGPFAFKGFPWMDRGPKSSGQEVTASDASPSDAYRLPQDLLTGLTVNFTVAASAYRAVARAQINEERPRAFVARLVSLRALNGPELLNSSDAVGIPVPGGPYHCLTCAGQAAAVFAHTIVEKEVSR